jgi:FdhE protein
MKIFKLTGVKMTRKENAEKSNAVIRKINKAASAIEKEKPFIKDLIRFYKKIFSLQYETEPDIKKDYSFLKEKKGLPVIERRDFDVDFNLSEALFKEICDICAGNAMNPDPSARSIKASLDVSDLSFESMVKEFLGEDSPTPQYSKSEGGFNPHLYDFILYNSIKPSIVKSAELISGYLKATGSMENGRCPVCKGAPALSLISAKTVSRSLVCGFCWHEYKAKKSVCPFCKNDDHKTLGHISLDTEKGIRADYCNKCKKYIKTINLKEYRKDIYIPLELISSMPFDMKMNQEGFKPE